MIVKSSIELICQNKTELEELFESIKIEIGEKKAAEINLYNVSEKCEPILKNKEMKIFKEFVKSFSETCDFLHEIQDKKNGILQNYKISKEFLKSLEIPETFEIEIESMISDETKVFEKQESLKLFLDLYQISDSDLSMFMNEDIPINAHFYSIFERILINIELQQVVINEEYIAKISHQQTTSDKKYESTFQMAKRLGMRKLNNYFEANLRQLIFETGEKEKILEFICLNNEKNLAKINEMTLSIVSENLRQTLESEQYSNRAFSVRFFADLCFAIDFSLDFLFVWTSQLFKKFSNPEIYFHNNVESVFAIGFPFLQSGYQHFMNSGAMKTEIMVIPDTFLRIKNLIRTKKMMGLQFSCEKVIDSMINEMKNVFSQLVKSFFDKLYAINVQKDVSENILARLHYFMTIFSFYWLVNNSAFSEIIFENLVKTDEFYRTQEFWIGFRKDCLSKCVQNEFGKMNGKMYQSFANLFPEIQSKS